MFVRLDNFKLSTLTPVALSILQAMTLTTKFTLSTVLVHGNSSLSLTKMGLRIHCLTCVELEHPVNSEIKSDILKISQVLRMDKYLEYMCMYMYMYMHVHVHIIKLTSMVQCGPPSSRIYSPIYLPSMLGERKNWNSQIQESVSYIAMVETRDSTLQPSSKRERERASSKSGVSEIAMEQEREGCHKTQQIFTILCRVHQSSPACEALV